MTWLSKLFGIKPDKPAAATHKSTVDARSDPRSPKRTPRVVKNVRLRTCDINKAFRRFRFTAMTGQESFVDVLKSRQFDVVECVKGHSVLTLGVDRGNFRFQVYEQNPFRLRWSSHISSKETLFAVFTLFAEDGDINDVIGWRTDSEKYGFESKGMRGLKNFARKKARPKSPDKIDKPINDVYQQYAQILVEERQKAEQRVAQERMRWEAQLREERLRWERKLKEAEAQKTGAPKIHKDYDYFAGILGVGRCSDKAAIKSMYRKKVMEYHPDRVAFLGAKLQKVAEDEMKQINEAYNFLLANS